MPVETPIQDLTPLPPSQTQPRAQGSARLTVKTRDGHSVISRLHQQGSLKVLFPRTDERALTAVTLNTAGGITGGDRFDLRLRAEPGTALTVTTQAAERAYRANESTGRVCTGIHIGQGARVDWLPQETLLYDRSALRRSLEITMEPDATCLLVESLIFGRAAMGERLRTVSLDDRITLRRNDKIIFSDCTRLSGDALTILARAATGAGAGAMASLVFAAPDAADKLESARAILPATGGVSQPARDVLFARILAPDGFALRQALIPLIAHFRQDPLPRPWTL